MHGEIASHLSGLKKKWKPTLQVNAFVSEPMPEPVAETKYLREDLKRCKVECAAIQKALDNWVPEDVAARAEKSLRKELKRKHARMAELEARLDAVEESEEEDEEEDEDENED